MSMEHKAVRVQGQKVLDEQTGIVETIVSVTGMVDEVHDNILPGAYQKTLAIRKPKGVWGHNWEQPISKTLDVTELMPGDSRLPSKDRFGNAWPDDAGALLVKTQFNLGTDRGRDAYSDVQFFGSEQEWSIGYQVPVGGSTFDSKQGVRKISTIDLYEYSPVLWGAMPSATTQDVKSIKDAQTAFKGLSEVERYKIYESAEIAAESTDPKSDSGKKSKKEKKVGRVLSGSNASLLKKAIEALQAVLATMPMAAPSEEADEEKAFVPGKPGVNPFAKKPGTPATPAKPGTPVAKPGASADPGKTPSGDPKSPKSDDDESDAPPDEDDESPDEDTAPDPDAASAKADQTGAASDHMAAASAHIAAASAATAAGSPSASAGHLAAAGAHVAAAGNASVIDPNDPGNPDTSMTANGPVGDGSSGEIGGTGGVEVDRTQEDNPDAAGLADDRDPGDQPGAQMLSEPDQTALTGVVQGDLDTVLAKLPDADYATDSWGEVNSALDDIDAALTSGQTVPVDAAMSELETGLTDLASDYQAAGNAADSAALATTLTQWVSDTRDALWASDGSTPTQFPAIPKAGAASAPAAVPAGQPTGLVPAAKSLTLAELEEARLLGATITY
jgi:HK97 family phage prohead protease